MADKVKDVQVIKLEEGKWAVTVSGAPGSFQVEEYEGQLICGCLQGLEGKFCQHKRAVTANVEQSKMNEERRLSGELPPAAPKS